MCAYVRACAWKCSQLKNLFESCCFCVNMKEVCERGTLLRDGCVAFVFCVCVCVYACVRARMCVCMCACAHLLFFTIEEAHYPIYSIDRQVLVQFKSSCLFQLNS